MKKFIMDKNNLWINILLMFLTYGIWLIVYIVLKLKYTNENKESQNKINKNIQEQTNQYLKEAEKRKQDQDDEERFYFNVAGVTYDNNDGSSRQAVIKNCKKFDNNNAFFKKSKYNGKPSIEIWTDYGQIGNVPSEYIDKILSIKNVHSYISNIDSFYNEKNKKTMFCEITVFYKKSEQ